MKENCQRCGEKKEIIAGIRYYCKKCKDWLICDSQESYSDSWEEEADIRRPADWNNYDVP